MATNFTMRPTINLVIPEPFIPLDEYCRRTNMDKATARLMIKQGRLPIKDKGGLKNGLVEINMAALTVEALSASHVTMNANA